MDIDTLCGKLANEFTPEELKKKVAYVNQHDIAPYPEWEKGAQDWILQNAGVVDPNSATLIIGPPPTETCPGRTAENFANRPTISIVVPTTGAVVAAGSKLPIQVTVNAAGGVDRVEYYLDNEFKYRTVVAPYDGLIRLPVGEADGVHHLITAKVFDKASYVGISNIDVVTSAVASP